MTATINLNALTRRGRRRASGRAVATEEARRRWETVRAAVAEQADDLADAATDQIQHARAAARPQVKRLRKQADVLADAAADQLKDARQAAAPHAQRLRSRAIELADPVADRVREEFADVSADLGPHVARLIADVTTATRIAAVRIIQTINDSAEQAREQAQADQRRGRVWALLGWTMFGMAAGAIFASEWGKRQQQDVAFPDVERDAGTARATEADPATGSAVERDLAATPAVPDDAAVTDPSGLPIREDRPES